MDLRDRCLAGAKSKDPDSVSSAELIQGVLASLVGGLVLRRTKKNSANIFERIPYIGFVREASSGSFDSASISADA